MKNKFYIETKLAFWKIILYFYKNKKIKLSNYQSVISGIFPEDSLLINR
jgi:hypothetical protein